MRPLLVGLTLAAALFAGCVQDDDTPSGPAGNDDLAPLGAVVNLTLPLVVDAMTFLESTVDAAVDFTGDLYEPTMEVCADGSIYITAHTILVDTTGAPVFGSHDGGATWAQLPLGPMGISSPGPVQGATPPPSDEIFLACGDDGWLYGGDITLATFPVNGWSGNGAELAYHNPNAYDEAEVRDASTESGCVPAPAKDRPWVAYSNGTLLMVSNPASGPAQIGTLEVPPMLPVSLGATVGGGSWNLCAGPGGLPASCNIPGIPDMRADGQFAVPQRCQGRLYLVTGNKADIEAVSLVEVFDHTSGGEITSVYGIAAYDAAGTLFVGISNNTAPDDDGNRTGQMRFAASLDGGETFQERVFVTGEGAHLRHFYMDANDFGPGALVVWAVDGEKDAEGNSDAYDWYMGHLQVDADGRPVLENVHLAIDEGPQPSAHVTGAAVGPDGRAYTAMYRSSSTQVAPPFGPNVPTPNHTPLSVFIQVDGPVLPVTAMTVAPGMG